MTSHADIISKLNADVAAANGPAPRRGARLALLARARIAALPGTELLERLISTIAMAHLAHWDPNSGVVTVDKCGLDPCKGNNDAIALAAKALEVEA